MIGRSISSGVAGVPKTLAPKNQARTVPIANPAIPPINASARCSIRKSTVTRVFVAPIAFITPISVCLSRTAAAEVAVMASDAATRAAMVTIQSSVLTRERMCPSESATRRMARTSVPGSTCAI